MSVELEEIKLLKSDKKNKKLTRVFSDAFPPDQLGHKERIPIHSNVHKHLDEIKQDKIYYRELIEKDKEEIKNLHKEWFPIDYDEDYFDKIFDHKKRNKEYFSLGAFYLQNEEEFILGAIICEIKSQTEFTNQIPQEAIQKLDISLSQDLNLFGGDYEFAYIMTLGVIQECRRLKLGSILLNKMNEFFMKRKNCLCIYLHVVDYNQTAINFYRRNKFLNVTTLKNYYSIKKLRYDCQVYVNFFKNEDKSKFEDTFSFKKILNSFILDPIQFLIFVITCGYFFRFLRRKNKLE